MGFFSSETLKKDAPISLKNPASCASCGRYKKCKTPKMKPYGDFRKKILIVVETPTEQDDKAGTPLTGRQGRAIERVLKKKGIDLFRDTLIVYAVSCYTEKGKIPKPNEIACCRPKVVQTIQKYKPNVILLFGEVPVQSVIGKNWKKNISSIQTWRGFQIPDREYNAWVCPVFPHWFIEYSEDKLGNQAELIWKQDLENALKLVNVPVPMDNEEDYIHYVFTDDEFREAIKAINKVPWFSFDYETTGLKPHAPGHEIICTSAAVSENEVYVWENNEYRNKVFGMVLKKGKIKKSAHNLSFENLWSRVILNTIVHGWFWCSLNTAHILDNRRSISGLKFQTYIRFGVVGYDDHIASWLESPPKQGANAFNKLKEYIKKYGIKPVLKYCALDSLFGYKLTKKQMEQIENEKTQIV